jgi:hypothetical protein
MAASRQAPHRLWKPGSSVPTGATLETSRPHGWGGELPEELCEEATRRLGLMALVWVGLAAFGIAVNHLVPPLLSLPPGELAPWGAPATWWP